jgi:hypothetical protein
LNGIGVSDLGIHIQQGIPSPGAMYAHFEYMLYYNFTYRYFSRGLWFSLVVEMEGYRFSENKYDWR